MSVKLRLRRMGRKKRPFYRIVAIDSRSARNGKYIEMVGYYDPIKSPPDLVIDHDIALKWLNDGAITSSTVRSLFKREGVLLRWDMSKRDYDTEKIEQAVKLHQESRRNKADKAAEEATKQAKKGQTAKKVKEEPPAPEVKAEPVAEEAKAEAPAEEAKVEEPKVEEPKAEAPAPEAVAEEVKAEEPKADAPAEEKKAEAKEETPEAAEGEGEAK
ncbi:30S ribosomal protein S16 [bacterium]|nr:30S ribosomal protein S16 [bacterium]